MNLQTLQARFGGAAAVDPGWSGHETNTGGGERSRTDRPGHVASLYTDRTARFDVVASFIRQGLQRNERCHYIAEQDAREAIEESLRTGDVAVDAALDRGALSFEACEDAYYPSGTFSSERMLDRVEVMVAETTADSAYDGFRSAGDMGWVLDGPVNTDEFLTYEAELNAVHAADDCLFLCEYDRHRFPQSVLSDVVQAHPFVNYDGVVCRNFHYYPPDEFAEAARPPVDIDRIARASVEHARLAAEHRAFEQELAARDGRYRTLVDHFPNGAVGLFDAELRYTALGGELLQHLFDDKEGLVGDSVLDHCPPSLVDRVEASLRAALGGEERTCELDYLGRHLLAQAVPVATPADDPPAGMIVVLDITERQEYEHKLEEARDRVEQFAHALSHDLKEPLRAISSYLQLLERRYEGELDAEADEFIAYAVDGAGRMRGIIDSLAAEYARFDPADAPMAPVELDTVVEDVLSDLHRKVEESDAEIMVEPLPCVAGNASQLNQLFANLLDNAIKYSGDGSPEIDLSAERDGELWIVSVRDRGVGIDPAEAASVFDMFSRLHEDDTTPGAGVGLALCQRIVERHGGTIFVDSVPGEGSVFSVTLPAADESG